MRRLNTIASPRQHGIALLAVLWIVAALSILVTSMGSSVRHELRTVSASRQTLAGQAIGQAAILLALQDLVSRPGRAQALSYVDTVFRDTPVRVRVLPLTGLIDINNAPPALLASLFRHAGAEAKRADALAAAAVEVRSARDGRGRPQSFEAPEDLLRVPGVDYTLYARLSTLVTADLQGTGRVSPSAAPDEVLMVLASGSVAPIVGLATGRNTPGAATDTTRLNGEFTDTNAHTQRFQLQARVPLSSGSWLLVSRTVDLGGGPNGLQWRIIHTDVRFEPVPAEGR
jgi:general secretion pathway protein K